MDAPTPPLLIRLLREPKRMTARSVELVWSAVATSLPGRTVRRVALAKHAAADWPPLKVALVAHVFYPDLMPEMLAAQALMPPGSPLIVTAPADRLDAIRAACDRGAALRLFEAPNRGRDVAPFVALLNDGVFDEFDVLLKLHSKKSPHLIGGGLRRRMVFHALAGDEGNVKRVLSLFATTEAGIAGPASLFRTRPSFWMANRDRVAQICARMCPPAPVQLGFFEGTMFWIRVAALEPLRQARLTINEFEPESGQLDGTLHHAIERVLPLSVLTAGFDVRSMTGQVLVQARPIQTS